MSEPDFDSIFITSLTEINGQVLRPEKAWLDFLKHALKTDEDSRAALCRKLGISTHALNKLFGGQRTSLTSLVRICEGFDTNPREVFTGEYASVVYVKMAVSHRNGISKRHSSTTRQIVGQALERAVDEGAGHSLDQIAEMYGVSRGYLRYWHAETTNALRRQRMAKLRRSQVQRTLKRRVLMRRAILAAIVEGIFPGRKIIESRIRKNGFSMLMPGVLEMYRELVKECLEKKEM